MRQAGGEVASSFLGSAFALLGAALGFELGAARAGQELVALAARSFASDGAFDGALDGGGPLGGFAWAGLRTFVACALLPLVLAFLGALLGAALSRRRRDRAQSWASLEVELLGLGLLVLVVGGTIWARRAGIVSLLRPNGATPLVWTLALARALLLRVAGLAAALAVLGVLGRAVVGYSRGHSRGLRGEGDAGGSGPGEPDGPRESDGADPRLRAEAQRRARGS